MRQLRRNASGERRLRDLRYEKSLQCLSESIDGDSSAKDPAMGLNDYRNEVDEFLKVIGTDLKSKEPWT